MKKQWPREVPLTGMLHEQVLDEINEQTDQMQQIQDAMAQPIGPAADMDEDELLGELEVLTPANLLLTFRDHVLAAQPCLLANSSSLEDFACNV